MKSNFLFVSIAGVPNILSDFIPDIGLASLASSLIERGNRVKILDLNNPLLFSRIYTSGIEEPLDRFARKVFMEGKKPSFKDILMLKIVNARLAGSKRRYCEYLKVLLSEFVEKEKID